MSIDDDVTALRAVLVPAIEGDLRRARRRGSRRLRIAIATPLVLAAGGGVAAATGVVFDPPKPNPAVPPVPEWQYYGGHPFEAGGGPVLMRWRPEALARRNRTSERLLAERGVTARCGEDRGHPLACFLPSGDPVPGRVVGSVLMSTETQERPSEFDVRRLSRQEAHRWLCTHPSQRPGADGGEKPPPTKGYEDC